jgi:acyl-coenzyme A synthetase/AMP-(fatty) acid ligase
MVPLDPFAPVEQLAAVITDADVAVLITDARAATFDQLVSLTGLTGAVVRSSAASDVIDVIRWDELPDIDRAPPLPVLPDDPAYIIYTSGSTGQPKGIVHTHRSALAYVRIAAAAYELRSDDRLANIAGLHFDQSTFELYVAPYVGCAVTVVPDAVLRFPASLSELVERERVTVWYSVPYVLRQLVSRGAIETRDLTSIRWILYGGESYPADELAGLMRALPGAKFRTCTAPLRSTSALAST